MSSLRGNITILRPLGSEDASLLCKWKNDIEVYQYLGGGYQPVSRSQYESWVEKMIDQTGSDRRFIIETTEHEPIGMIGLYDINWIHRTVNVGVFIGEQTFRRQGAASEAYRLLENFAKACLNLRKVNIKVVDDNEKGKAFWTKMGFSLAGTLHAERYINGKYCDVHMMEKFIQDVK